MAIKQTNTGRWACEIYRKGMPRSRKLFDTKGQAESYEREYVASFSAVSAKIVSDPRKLSDLAELWFKYHGINLADGVRRFRVLKSMAKGLGDPPAMALSAEQFVEFRFKRLAAGLSAKTFNNQQSYLSAMFERLIKLNVYQGANPLAGVDAIKVQQRMLSYLSEGQVGLLMDTISDGCINESTWFVAQLCIRTGARWGEAEKLRLKQLRNNTVTYEFTKSKKTRTLPLEPAFFGALMAFAKDKNPDDRVFTNCIGAFRRAVKRAGINLPKGQCSHILRHTCASHFVMNGGNILTLQKVLGHSDIKMTMNYAHLAPDHLNDILRLNPLAASGSKTLP
jgi:integrase